MCFIITTIKLKEDDMAKNAILNVMRDQQKDNSHGTASLFFNRKGKATIQRDMVMASQEFEKSLEYDITSHHFRSATQGEKTLQNVHYWEHGNWAFCHNGTVSKLGNDKESDSLLFFRGIVEKGYLPATYKIKLHRIREYADEQSLWGRFIIINLKSKDMYFFGDFHVYLLNKSYLTITSMVETFDSKQQYMGLEFDEDTEVESLESELEGVYVFNASKWKFRQLLETMRIWKNVSYGYDTTKANGHSSYKWVEGKKVWINGGKYEEKGNLNSKEKEVKQLTTGDIKPKKRTIDSFIKEFYARLHDQMEIYPLLATSIEEEYSMGAVNEMGRTDTEQAYWDLWIAPKLKKAGMSDFSLTDAIKESAQR